MWRYRGSKMKAHSLGVILAAFALVGTACDAPAAPAATEAVAPAAAAPAVTRERVVRVDLLPLPAKLSVAGANVPQPQSNVHVASWGKEADAVWINPGARVQYDGLTVQPGDHLETSITIHDQSVGASDGAAFVVLFNDGAADIEIFRKDVDRAAIDAAGGWLKVDIDLAALAGKTGALIFTLEPGTAGSDVGDWGLWASPAIKS